MQLSNLFLQYIVPIISPTYLITNLVKNSQKAKQEQELRKKLFKKINSIYFFLDWLFFGLLLLWSYWINIAPFLARIAFFLISYYAVSRVIEIFLALLLDSLDKMKNKPHEKNLKYSDRYIIALKSYLELILNYGIIFYALSTNYAQYLFASPQGLFNKSFNNIFEATYYSVSTITILGYGDISPTHFLTQLFSIFQVLTGVFLLIVTFTIYVTLNFTNHKVLKPKKRKSKIKKSTLLIGTQILLIFVLIILGTININQWLN
ncbi:potassium channel family protein [Fuchsiella alkaliacetigena]|uniref:potassium channel family protein n=1 Tax=Fuchsiella alkaliacetigena TaxID=957042 RepID=UPI00200AED39|nr:potassium channel family protein [Fuchsiella alkaliacetigena]MCK8825848.1 potassium channel family protein [Fuchsiella alkaliacetigena]